MISYKQCPNCGYNEEAHAKFCSGCGAGITGEPLRQVVETANQPQNAYFHTVNQPPTPSHGNPGLPALAVNPAPPPPAPFFLPLGAFFGLSAMSVLFFIGGLTGIGVGILSLSEAYFEPFLTLSIILGGLGLGLAILGAAQFISALALRAEQHWAITASRWTSYSALAWGLIAIVGGVTAAFRFPIDSFEKIISVYGGITWGIVFGVVISIGAIAYLRSRFPGFRNIFRPLRSPSVFNAAAQSFAPVVVPYTGEPTPVVTQHIHPHPQLDEQYHPQQVMYHPGAFCRICGRPLNESEAFCPSCGADKDTGEAQA